MGSCFSSESSARCVRCNSKATRNSDFVNNKCRSCNWNEQLQHQVTLSTFSQVRTGGNIYTPQVRTSGNIYTPQVRTGGNIYTPPSESSTQRVATSRVRVVKHQSRPKPVIDDPQFGEFRCKLCGRSWKSLRCWPNRYQMCKRCKKPVYPTNCRETLSSDYTASKEDSKEHERDLCQMCQQLGYSCRKIQHKKKIY